VSRFAAQLQAVESSMPYRVVGQVLGVGGLTIEASGLSLPVGSMCRITSLGGAITLAEVIGFHAARTLLMPLSGTAGVSRGDRIENLAADPVVRCCEQLQGRVLDGFGEPIDGKGPVPMGSGRSMRGVRTGCLERAGIDQPIATSVRAIDALHTCGLGQRVGIFSGPGVGKSTLLGQVARETSADMSVVALVGERGREVREFLEHGLGSRGMERCVVVVSTSDEAPLLRVRATRVALTIAEYFRDQGKNVLLLLDSLTRLCHAQRQIGLAAREPPATKGFPPSVFAMLPEILERAGKTETGSITGFYTVLVEGDDFNEPIPDAVKGIVDGHLWLSRGLANRGHYPAIDVMQCLSRVRSCVTDAEQVRQARRVLSILATWNEVQDLVSIGAYVPGTSLETDLAVHTRQRIEAFLRQDSSSPTTMAGARKELAELSAWIDQAEKVIRAQSASMNGGGKAPPASAAAANIARAPVRAATAPAAAPTK
jgi:FliI/YscN family ATPase